MPAPRQRLLIVTELFPNDLNPNLGTFVYAQLLELRQWYDITVITAHWTPLLKKLSNPQQKQYQQNGLVIYSLPYYPWWIGAGKILKILNQHQAATINKKIIAKKMLALAARLHRQQQFDLVHGHEIYLGDEAGPIGAALQIPSVFTLHSLYAFHQNSFGSTVLNQAIKNLRLIQKLLAVSARAADTYRALPTPLEPWEIIPNGVYPQTKTAPNSDITAFAQGRLVLLSAGALAPDKRFDLSVRALAKTPPTEAVLVIIGRGPELPKLKKLAGQLGCQDRILWLDVVAPAELASVYSAADILVHPSVVESFSMVCLEAMAQGLAVITTNTIGLVEFVHAGTELFTIPPNDELALTSAVQNLLSNSVLRQALGQGGQQRAQQLTWSVVADRLHSLYNHLRVTPK